MGNLDRNLFQWPLCFDPAKSLIQHFGRLLETDDNTILDIEKTGDANVEISTWQASLVCLFQRRQAGAYDQCCTAKHPQSLCLRCV